MKEYSAGLGYRFANNTPKYCAIISAANGYRDLGIRQSKRLVIVSKDTDFQARSLLYGHPPKFIWLRVGNCPVSTVGLLDGAFERRIVELTCDNQIQAVDLDEFCLDAKNTEERKAHLAELSKAYQELSQAWGAWRKLSGPRLNR